MTSTHVGILFLLLFATAQGVRDAYFGNVFQSVSFFFVALLAFGTSTIVFLAWSLIRKPGDVARLFAEPGNLFVVNATTAAAWLLFFFGLRNLEPAVVATLFNGIGPLVVLVSSWIGWTSDRNNLGGLEKALYICLAVTLTCLCAIVLSNASGLQTSNMEMQLLALAGVIFGGAMITTSYVYTRAMTDRGIGSDAVMGVRFFLTLLIALAMEIGTGDAAYHPTPQLIPILAGSAFLLIVIPSFLVQSGVSRTSPLLANVFRALGPVCVFGFQQFDGRLQFSGATLACIIAFSAITIAASLIRGWRESNPT
ncbi:MAG: hypothetical protein AAGD43_28525 [Pseudomonadota bacterium]